MSSVVETLKRIANAGKADAVPVLDSADLPRFPLPDAQPIDPQRLHALAADTLSAVASKRAALPDENEAERAAAEAAEIASTLARLTRFDPERARLAPRRDALLHMIDMRAVIARRLGECEQTANGALRRAEAWINVDRAIKESSEREQAARRAKDAAVAEADRLGGVQAATQKKVAELTAEREPLAALRGELLADEITGGAVDAGTLKQLRARLDQLDREIAERQGALDAIGRKLAAAQATAEQQDSAIEAARSEARRLDGVRRERDCRQAAAAAAELIRARLPKQDGAYQPFKPVLDLLATELARP